MTNPTALIELATPSINYLLEKHPECPRLPEWCDLCKEGCSGICEWFRDGGTDPELSVHNEAAVLDAIVVWVNGEVCPWINKQSNKQPSQYSTGVYWEQRLRQWIKSINAHTTFHNTYPEATIALLTAIVASLKEAGGG